jgi:hypothetical protein
MLRPRIALGTSTVVPLLAAIPPGVVPRRGRPGTAAGATACWAWPRTLVGVAAALPAGSIFTAVVPYR